MGEMTEDRKTYQRNYYRGRLRMKRSRDLERLYGISIEDYESMLTSQNGVCAICQQSCPTGYNLSVDHDHQTGRVRGLLCVNCNSALGKFQDDPDLLVKAASYLRRL